jgi:hypothetical protein
VLVGFVAASGTGVLDVAGKTMCPAIIELNAVATVGGCGGSFAVAVGIFVTALCGRGAVSGVIQFAPWNPAARAVILR